MRDVKHTRHATPRKQPILDHRLHDLIEAGHIKRVGQRPFQKDGSEAAGVVLIQKATLHVGLRRPRIERRLQCLDVGPEDVEAMALREVVGAFVAIPLHHHPAATHPLLVFFLGDAVLPHPVGIFPRVVVAEVRAGIDLVRADDGINHPLPPPP